MSEALDIVLEYARPDSAGQILTRYSNFTSGNTQLLLLKSQLSPENSEATFIKILAQAELQG